MHKYVLLESGLTEKDLGIPVDTKSNMSQQYALVVKKVNDILGCLKQNTAGRLRHMILPLYTVLLRLHLECWVQFWDPHCKQDMGKLERF